ncbi:hypothetical protein J6590_067792 [Homalodisca vitripennis]|nr:hypothetical protein J6590_067792 [Homalodisca vitripennis]
MVGRMTRASLTGKNIENYISADITTTKVRAVAQYQRWLAVAAGELAETSTRALYGSRLLKTVTEFQA